VRLLPILCRFLQLSSPHTLMSHLIHNSELIRLTIPNVLKELKHLFVALSSVIKFFIALLAKKKDMNKCLML
jgi:hypothetical protein